MGGVVGRQRFDRAGRLVLTEGGRCAYCGGEDHTLLQIPLAAHAERWCPTCALDLGAALMGAVVEADRLAARRAHEARP